jgi:DNA-binding NarL/FixJ family response regulator
MNTRRQGPVRVLVAAHQQPRQVGEALASALRAEPHLSVVDITIDLAATIASIRQTKPDVVLLDSSRMPSDGARAIAALRRQFPALRVIALDLAPEEPDLVGYIRAGAVGVVSKDRPLAELFRSIEQAHAD